MVVDNSADEYIVGCAPSSPSPPPRLTLEKGGRRGGGRASVVRLEGWGGDGGGRRPPECFRWVALRLIDPMLHVDSVPFWM